MPSGSVQSPPEEELERVLASKTFAQSPQLCRFLRFLVEQELAGHGDTLKEYTVAVQVFRRPESFDPRIDTVVRTEARRLRQKLAEYYQAEGRDDPIEIVLPKGNYRPIFQVRVAEVVAPAAVAPRRRPGIRIAGAILAVLALALLAWFGIGRPQRAPSIAVLPFQNLSGDPGQEYFSDGMTDALFTDLAKLHGLSVISRSSMMQYKAAKKTVPEMARELKVDYVVDGAVTRAGDRVRITARLIAAASDRHVWGESYERAPGDILGVQRELAQAIAQQVNVHITPQEQAQLVKRPVDLEAQELYLKGRFNWQTRETDRLRQSLDYFNRAIAKDPGYALAYAGLADSYAVLSYRTDRKDYVARACEAAKKAIELDANLGEAYASLDGCQDQWNWPERERLLRQAIEFSPSYATAHQWYGGMLIDMGRIKEGLPEVRRALELDPLAPSPNNGLCMSLYFARQYDQAIQQCRQTMEIFPKYIELYYGLGFAYTAKGMYAQAIAILEKAMSLTSEAPPVASLLAHARMRAGDKDAVPRLLREYSTRSDIGPMIFGLLHLDAGDRDQAFFWLERAVAQQSFGSNSIRVHPELDPLHSDPRWPLLLRKMNLAN